MRPHARRKILVAIVFVLTSGCLVFIRPSAQSASPQVPTITLSTMHGFSAEISNYSSANGVFTFTVTNNSHLTLDAIGADLGQRTPVFIVSQSGPNFPFHVDPFIEGSGSFENKLSGVQMSFILSSPVGLEPGQSTTISLSLQGDAEFIANRMFVSFFPELQLNCATQIDFENPLIVQITRFQQAQHCLVFTNLSTEVMTGIAFDFEDDRGVFELLSITPSRQPFNQHFRFSKIAEPIPSHFVSSDFAILAGGRFGAGANQIGIEPGETSSEFCVAGDFAGLTHETIVQSIYVRANNLTRQCEIRGGPIGGGHTGILAGALR